MRGNGFRRRACATALSAAMVVALAPGAALAADDEGAGTNSGNVAQTDAPVNSSDEIIDSAYAVVEVPENVQYRLEAFAWLAETQAELAGGIPTQPVVDSIKAEYAALPAVGRKVISGDYEKLIASLQAEVDALDKDLSKGTLVLSRTYCAVTGKVIVPETTLEGGGGNVVPSGSYTVSYERYSAKGKSYSPVGADGIGKTGTYRVTATAEADSGCTGSTVAWLRVGGSGDGGRPVGKMLALIAALPPDVRPVEFDYTPFEEARAFYDGLSTAQKRAVPFDAVAKMVSDLTVRGISKSPAKTIDAKRVTAAKVRAVLGDESGRVVELRLGKKVCSIVPRALAGTEVRTLVVKTKKLAKKRVGNALAGSKVKTVRVAVGNKKVNKKYVKKYKKVFVKKTVGKKVVVRR